jgi:hypothetical protein
MARRVSSNTLLVRWDKTEQDFKVWYPNKCDGGFAIGHLVGEFILVGDQICPHCFKRSPRRGFESTFVKELEKRGYDSETLRFSIKRKK